MPKRGWVKLFRNLLEPGAQFVCIENTLRPELNGQMRTIDRVQAKSFRWLTPEGCASWTDIPKAADILEFWAVGSRGGLLCGYEVALRHGPQGAHVLRLRFLEGCAGCVPAAMADLEREITAIGTGEVRS